MKILRLNDFEKFATLQAITLNTLTAARTTTTIIEYLVLNISCQNISLFKKIIENSTDFNTYDHKRYKPFYYVAKLGDFEMIMSILDKITDLHNLKTRNGSVISVLFKNKKLSRDEKIMILTTLMELDKIIFSQQIDNKEFIDICIEYQIFRDFYQVKQFIFNPDVFARVMSMKLDDVTDYFNGMLSILKDTGKKEVIEYLTKLMSQKGYSFSKIKTGFKKIKSNANLAPDECEFFMKNFKKIFVDEFDIFNIAFEIEMITLKIYETSITEFH